MKSDFRRYIHILEAHEEAYRIDLPYNMDALEPSISKETLELHYGTLHKNYVEKALDGIDYEFNLAGLELHNLYFAQFRAPRSNNKPHGASLNLIEKEWGNENDFRTTFEDTAKSLTGSGWCYLSTNGTIKTIQNHKRTKGVALILDLWEHAYILDYGSKKDEYMKNFWKIVDWNIVNARIET